MALMRKAIRRWAFLAAILVGGGANAALIQITVDTSSLNGTSAVLAFDLIDGGPPPNSVAISSFGGGTLGAASSTGDVTGSFAVSPGIVTLGDTSFFAEYLQAITLDNSFSFIFGTSENAADPASFPDGFSFFILDEFGFAPLFATNDPTGADALFLYSIGSPTPLEAYSNTVTALVIPDTNGVPEPSALALTLAGLLALGSLRSARSHRIRRDQA